jgi:TPP-dependent 2-oxoacid decarboxylase
MAEREFVDQNEVATLSIGEYLAVRLVESGVSKFFTIPGDFTLALLDCFLKKNIKEVGTCNELNAGYAVDGYCRATGKLGVLCVTYMVGGLSCMNAIAGSYSEDLPVLIVSGGPNTNDASDRNILHHTIGKVDLYQSSQCFGPVVKEAFVIRHLSDAARMIDRAISTCIEARKPVYLEVPCNLVQQLISVPPSISIVRGPKQV